MNRMPSSPPTAVGAGEDDQARDEADPGVAAALGPPPEHPPRPERRTREGDARRREPAQGQSRGER